MKKFLLYSILLLALVGAADAVYLLAHSVSGDAVACPNVTLGRFDLGQCGAVLASPYSSFLGLPLALYGLGAYLLFIILALIEIAGKWPAAKKLLFYLSGFGFLMSLYFIYLQIFVIGAICIYCVISATAMTLIFASSATYNFKYFENMRA